MSPLPDGLSKLPLDHVAIAVADLRAASEPYRLLGMTETHDERVEGQGVAVRMLGSGEQRIELLEPLGPDSPVARFLAKRGAGLHHIGLKVENLEAEVDRLTNAGARFTDPVPRTGHGGTRIVFLHPAWTGGVLIELVERPANGEVLSPPEDRAPNEESDRS